MTENQDTFAELNTVEKTKTEKTVARSTLIWLCLFALFVAIAATVWFINQQYELQKTALASMQDQLLQQQEKLSLEQDVFVKETEQQLVSQQTLVQEGLNDLASRVDSNATKLLALSSVSRDDWKLAEAVYLLRMADYRLLMEKDNLNALALAESADDVLSSLDQSGVQQVRKLLAEDMAVIRIAGRVDREGTYMQLGALANQLDAMSFTEPLQEEISVEESDNDIGFMDKTKNFFNSILRKMSVYVRVRDHGKRINAILPPDEQIYLRQNLRLMLEQAQAALLRGEKDIYQDALIKSQNWINQYFYLNEQSKAMLLELKALEQINVEPDYGNFENSRSALQDYIERSQRAAVRRMGGRS